jgi:hypothetical protein
MVTDNKDQRVIIPMSAAMVEAIDDWRFANRIPTRAEAIRRLLELGLDAAPKQATSQRPARRRA